jgi:hypothetical protein
MKLSIGQAWSEATAVLRRDGGLIATVALALLVLPGALVGIIAPPGSTGEEGGPAGILVLIATLIAFAGQIAIARIALGPALTVGQAIGLGFQRFLSFFAAWILWLLPFILVVALILTAGGVDVEALSASNSGTPPSVPGWVSLAIALLMIMLIVVAARMLLLTPAAAAERLGPVGLLKRSWQLSRGHSLKLFGLLVLLGIMFVVLVLGLGSAIGTVVILALGRPEAWSISALLLALVEGVLSAVISVFSAVLLARAYAQLTGSSQASVSVPDAGHS